MGYAAFSDTLRSGTHGELAAVLAAAAPATSGDRPPGLLGVTAFRRGDTLVRVAETDGDADAAALLADDAQTVAAHDRLRPYLREPAGADPGAWAARAMRRVQQRIVRPAPDAALSALWYAVHPGHEDRIAETFTHVVPQQRPVLHGSGGDRSGLLHGVAVFVRGTAMVRVVSYTGDIEDVARYMAGRPGRPEIERRLAPYLAEPEDTTAEADFLRSFPGRLMTPLPVAAPVR